MKFALVKAVVLLVPMFLQSRYELGTNFWQASKDPFSDVSKPILPTEDLFFEICEIDSRPFGRDEMRAFFRVEEKNFWWCLGQPRNNGCRDRLRTYLWAISSVARPEAAAGKSL